MSSSVKSASTHPEIIQESEASSLPTSGSLERPPSWQQIFPIQTEIDNDGLPPLESLSEPEVCQSSVSIPVLLEDSGDSMPPLVDSSGSDRERPNIATAFQF